MRDEDKSKEEPIEESGRLRRELAETGAAGPDESAKALRRQTMLVEAFFKHTLGLIVLLDKDFNFHRVSEAYAKACGRQAEEFTGRNYFEIYPSDSRTIFEDVLRSKEPYRATARPFLFPDHPDWGVTYWDWTLVPLPGDGGEVEMLVFSLNDVTESRRAEQKLQGELNFQQTLIDTVPIPIYYKDAEARFLSCNTAFEEFFGLKRRDIVGKTVRVIAPEDLAAVYSEHDLELLEHPGVQIYETKARDGRGQLHDVVSHKATFTNPEGRIEGLVGAMLDVTGRKRAQEALAVHTAQVESLNEDLQEFAFVASHDLLEPLRKIQGFGDLLRNRFREVFDEEGKDFLDRMTRSANRMETLLARFARLFAPGNTLAKFQTG